MDVDIIQELLKGFQGNDRGKNGTPGAVTNFKISKIPTGFKLTWTQPESPSISPIRYKVYMLAIRYDPAVQDMVVRWRPVYNSYEPACHIKNEVLDTAAVYVDPDDSAYHFVVIGNNCLGEGLAEYFSSPTE